jgi:hypothetical protein
METQQKVATILRMIEQELSEFISSEENIRCPIEYEDKVLALGKQFMLGIMKGDATQLPKSRNSKKKS